MMAESKVLAELTLIAGVDLTYQLLNSLTDNPQVVLGFIYGLLQSHRNHPEQ